MLRFYSLELFFFFDFMTFVEDFFSTSVIAIINMQANIYVYIVLLSYITLYTCTALFFFPVVQFPD